MTRMITVVYNQARAYLVQVQRLRFSRAHDVIHGEGEEADLSQLPRLPLLPFSHTVQL